MKLWGNILKHKYNYAVTTKDLNNIANYYC